MHRRAAARNGSHAHAEAGRQIDLAHDRLSHRHGAERAGQPVDVGAGDVDAVELALEGAGILAQRQRHERSADACDLQRRPRFSWHPCRDRSARRGCGCALESKRSSSVLRVAVCRDSTRSSEACSRASAPSTPTPWPWLRCSDPPAFDGSSRDSSRASRSGGAVKITVSLIGEALGGLRRLGVVGHRRRAALDRAGRGRIGDAGKRRGPRFQRRLPAHDLLELLLELLLVEQLPAGDAVDLSAKFGDAVLVGELHAPSAGAISRVSTSSWKAK